MRILELYCKIRRGRLRGELPPGFGGHVLEPVLNQKEEGIESAVGPFCD